MYRFNESVRLYPGGVIDSAINPSFRGYFLSKYRKTNSLPVSPQYHVFVKLHKESRKAGLGRIAGISTVHGKAE